MSDISQYLNDILAAVYGEEVRGSIHDAIDIINKVGEKVLTLGTDVTSASSSVEGYYDKSLYLNSNTFDLWECNGVSWVNKGTLKGVKGDSGESITATSSKTGKVTTVTITDRNTGAFIESFQVLDGADGQGSGDMTKAAYDSTGEVENAGGIAAYVETHGGGGSANNWIGTHAQWDSDTGNIPKANLDENSTVNFTDDATGGDIVATSEYSNIDAYANNDQLIPSVGLVQKMNEELNSNLFQNEFVVNDDLASYTQANPYICRNDGYLYIDGTQTVAILGATSASTTQANAASNNNSVTLFVKKGMRLYRQSGSGNIKFKGIG